MHEFTKVNLFLIFLSIFLTILSTIRFILSFNACLIIPETQIIQGTAMHATVPQPFISRKLHVSPQINTLINTKALIDSRFSCIAIEVIFWSCNLETAAALISLSKIASFEVEIFFLRSKQYKSFHSSKSIANFLGKSFMISSKKSSFKKMAYVGNDHTRYCAGLVIPSFGISLHRASKFFA